MSTTVSSPYYIGFPPTSSAEDYALFKHVTDLINTICTIAERGIFHESYARTHAEEVRDLLRAKQLALASTSCTFSPPSDVIGCVYVVQLSVNLDDFGTLVTAPKARRSGLRRQLIDFAEAYCRSQETTQMQLELVVPTTFVSESKAWLRVWYEKLGYKI